MLLDGTEGQLMFDNITVSQDGKITLCEDPGNADRVAKVWQYDPATASLTELAHHDPARFDPNLNGPGQPGPNFVTKDEESSGVVDICNILGNAGEHTFLIDTQSGSRRRPGRGRPVDGDAPVPSVAPPPCSCKS